MRNSIIQLNYFMMMRRKEGSVKSNKSSKIRLRKKSQTKARTELLLRRLKEKIPLLDMAASACSIAFFLLLSLTVSAQHMVPTDPTDIALLPQQNNYRDLVDLSGIWDFKVDSLDQGEQVGWYKNNRLSAAPLEQIAVPGSWNEQKVGLRDYMGPVWYEKSFFVPKSWQDRPVYIRVGSANYLAKVWVNGKAVCYHEGGNIPFAMDISSAIQVGQENRVTIRVENELKPERVPVGGEGVTNTGGGMLSGLPLANFDFFPYGGLQRAVYVYALPKRFIRDITLQTDYTDAVGQVHVKLALNEVASKAANNLQARLHILDDNGKEVSTASLALTKGAIDGALTLSVPAVKLWQPGSPYLYSLAVELLSKGAKDAAPIDSYQLEFGIRTVEVKGAQILVNGQPVQLNGFGKHEDFPIFGRGTALPVMVKDYDLMKWIGANSFRTSHYPYSEQYMDMADRAGVMVIDETPSVGLFFDDDKIDQRKQVCARYIEEMVARDKNRPSVIMWSIANEPIQSREERAAGATFGVANAKSIEFFKDLYHTIKQLDTTRPATMANMEKEPLEWLALGDVVCINRYYGWYTEPGDIIKGTAKFAAELDEIYAKIKKPIIVTEFGADALSGTHALEPEMFSEEYQVSFLKHYMDAAAARPFVAGMMIWAFADFKTSQGTTRTNGMNYKGVFTRDRKPKMAAYYLRERWLGKKVLEDE